MLSYGSRDNIAEIARARTRCTRSRNLLTGQMKQSNIQYIGPAESTWGRMTCVHLSLPALSTCFQVSLALLLCLSLGERVDAQNPNRRHEVRILLNFKADSISDYGDQLYWNHWKEKDKNPCAWFGVTCTDNFTVWQLDFSSWGIDSVPGLGRLSELPDLRQLDLSNNNLYTIPDAIGTLTGLTRLDLSGNYLSGPMPGNISALRSLRYLALEQNSFSGEVDNLSGVVRLQILDLSYNQFSGPFPKDLGVLSSLESLDLSNNHFNGTVPDLRHLTNLFNLNLSSNNFEGFEQYWSLAENSTLNSLDVSYNQLQGAIPSSITNLLNLSTLDLSYNQLSGGIPPGMLQSTTSLTSTLYSCTQLSLSNNFLTGNLPIDGVNNSCFDTLDLSYNNLSGPLPSNIFDLINIVSYFGIQNNGFSGDIVDVFEGNEWQSIQEIHLEDNLFTGDLYRIVRNYSGAAGGLQILDLSNNDLRWSMSEAVPDPIAATLETLMSFGGLSELRIGGNNFSGTSLPTTCFVNESSGQVPLRVLDLSNSNLQGEISGLVFDDQCVSSLNYLNLSNNNVTGQVPESIVSLSNLSVLDISNNHLSGPLPYISLDSSLVSPSFFHGNDGLCGYPLHSCPEVMPKGTGVSWWELFIIIVGAMTTALGSCLAAAWRWRVYHKRHQQDADLIKTLMDRDSATLMSLRELKKATHNFAPSAQIGEGGFGTVYGGTLDDGTIVAIKRSKREGSEKDKEQFLNEVKILSHVNHRNLVKLLGCCMENKISLLVFEFVSNGTLEEHLHGKFGDVPLSWKQRLKIALQTADALNYLHSATTIPIYHRDVKSANILLDEDLNAKVADFGISKLAPIEATHVSTVGMGTLGYIDPEYWISYQLTNKSDVYSFGVVLLELISAKLVIDAKRGEEEISLVLLAIPQIKSGDLQHLIDPSLSKTYNRRNGKGRESILNVGRLAMKCLDIQSKARPSMIEVLKELQDLCFEFNGTFMELDPLNEDDVEASPHGHRGLSFPSRGYDFRMLNAVRNLEMSQFTRSASCN